MKNYFVKPGDTLAKIASDILGDASNWRLIAEVNQLVNPNKIKVGQKLLLPDVIDEAPNVVHAATGTQAVETENIRMITEGKTVFTIKEDGQWIRVGKLFKKGLFRIGQHAPEQFIKNSGGLLQELNLTQSEINVMLATSENEGNLDAVNTWDNQFISFGMFQWTAGGVNKPGELAALLNRLKQQYSDDYQHYFGRFGLDVVDVGSKTGWISLDGNLLRDSEEKAQLREYIWAYRFAQAGADEQVKAVEVAHAIGRISQFYFNNSSKMAGHSLADLITSEYGVALLLDNHVNRPGYVFGCIADAISNCGMQPADLKQGSTDDERRVIDEYLDIRKTYGGSPMTDAEHRGEITRRYLVDGSISAERGSFNTDRR